MPRESMTMQLTPLIEGRQDGPTLFFIQGWPDDVSVWDTQVAALKDRYRCVRVNMPNYGDAADAPGGYTTDEIVEGLTACIRAVSSPGAQVTLIIHDWGAYWGYIVHHRNPALVERLVGLDIAPHLKPTPLAALGAVSYQGWLAGAFLLGGPVGDWMTRGLAGVLRAPAPRDRIHARMNYPYRNAFADVASGRFRRRTPGYRPGPPLLFVYGKRKPFPFHSQQWLDHVREVGGEVVALDCGHWVQKDPAFTGLLVDWLARTDRAPA